jgi:hypothetical protein
MPADIAGVPQTPEVVGMAECIPMSRSDSPRFPVTVTKLPVTRCEVCGRTLAHRPGQASAVLTEHYHRMHPDALTDAADERN